MSRSISEDSLRLPTCHLIHNCYECTAARPTLRCGGPHKPELLTELLLRLTYRGTLLSTHLTIGALGSSRGRWLVSPVPGNGRCVTSATPWEWAAGLVG